MREGNRISSRAGSRKGCTRGFMKRGILFVLAITVSLMPQAALAAQKTGEEAAAGTAAASQALQAAAEAGAKATSAGTAAEAVSKATGAGSTGATGSEAAAAASYEAVSPQYQYDDSAKAQLPKSASSRYTLKNGIYKNLDAKETGEATLIITGDLMCQYLQQEAVFKSDGTSYLSYSDVKKIIEEAEAKQQEAIEAKQQEAAEAEAAASQALQAKKEAAASQALQAAAGAPAQELPEEPAQAETEDQELAAAEDTIPPLDLGVIKQPSGTFDFAGSFQYVKKIFAQGDLVIGNLETMVSQSSPLGMQIHRLEDKPYLNAPVSYLDALNYAGYDLLTMANNHNCDTGVRGIMETITNVDNYKFMHTGLFTDEEQPRYLIVDVNGIKIGIVAYATYYNQKEDNLTESGQQILLNQFSTERAKADIKAARAAGAEYVIAFMHWGAENTNETTANQERNARAIAKAGADYIVGSHPHALQTYDIIETSDGRQVPVVYSMGNFVSNMSREINTDTIILRLNLVKGADGKVTLDSQRYYPCNVVKSLTTASGQTTSYVVVPEIGSAVPKLDSAKEGDSQTLKLLEASYDRILKIYGNRMVLPLPYDPYQLEEDEAISTLSNLSNRIRYIKKSAA